MQRSIVDIGMKCFDKQLYDVTKQVCWYVSSSYAYNSRFLPALKFETLMKSSAMEFYVIAVDGGIRGI